MTMNNNQIEGAKNLLINCAQMKDGETLLIVVEDQKFGWYDAATAKFIEKQALAMGFETLLVNVGGPEISRCPTLDAQIKSHDCTIFFSRIGDQVRFSTPPKGTRSVMSYIRDLDMLGSPYGRTNYHAYREFKNAVDSILFKAQKIKITCPLGTNFIGALTEKRREEQEDVSVSRFPLGVPTPLEAKEFSGQISMDRFLAPTGSKVYAPAFVKITAPVIANVEKGRILNFTGDAKNVANIKKHYKNISEKFNIDPDIVHSWHAGIHPGSDYKRAEADDPDCWSNSVFTNPNYVHFHTCGDYAPGEISCTIPEHSIEIDGILLWDKGKLLPLEFEETKQVIHKWPELAQLF